MSSRFDDFVATNKSQIRAIGDSLKHYEIDAKAIGMRDAQARVVRWLKNFDEAGFGALDLPLSLLERLDIIQLDDVADRIVGDASALTKRDDSYITCLGEPSESSFRITSRLNRHPRYFLSLASLLDSLLEPGKCKILLFDDFLNSGAQLISIFYALLGKALPRGAINDECESRTALTSAQIKALKRAQLHIFYFQAFDEGAKAVAQRVRHELGLDVTIHSHFATNHNDSVFGDQEEQERIEEGAVGRVAVRSLFRGRHYAELTKFYLLMRNAGEQLLRVNEPQWEEEKIAARALGYGNLSRAIVSYNNVPTVTLTALWQSGAITIEGTQVTWHALVPRRKKVLPARTGAPLSAETDSRLALIAEELQALYENDEFREGLKKADLYFEQYGAKAILLKHALRFNLRDKNWARVADIVEQLDGSGLADDERALCEFARFECSLREAYEFRADTERYSAAIRHIRVHLNHVPASFRNSTEYHYLLGRWHLEMWWAHRETNSLTNLAQALVSFDAARRVKDTWWAECYRCIVLRLLESPHAVTAAEHFKTRIFQYQAKKALQPSVRLHCITALLLLDDAPALQVYLADSRTELSPTDFEDSLVHRMEMIFVGSTTKQDRYRQMLTAWIAILPRK